jgi:hypothetical protein
MVKALIPLHIAYGLEGGATRKPDFPQGKIGLARQKKQ